MAPVSCAAEAQDANACTSLLEATKVVPEDEPSKMMACRAEIASLADQRRKLVESERKSYREAQEILTPERAKPSSQDTSRPVDRRDVAMTMNIRSRLRVV
jgi:hypothetical protein